MKLVTRFAILATAVLFLFLLDMVPEPNRLPPGLHLMSDAHAVLGTRRRAHRRGVAVGYSAGAAAGAQQQAAADQQAAAAAAPAPAAPPPPPPPPVYGPLAIGTIVTVLPAGCQTTTSGGVEYYQCSSNYFRTAFQGNTLVYVAATPGQ